jgi:hypothetical protein
VYIIDRDGGVIVKKILEKVKEVLRKSLGREPTEDEVFSHLNGVGLLVANEVIEDANKENEPIL